MSKLATEEMLTAYNELNGDIDQLHEDPSPLDFMRYVAKNRPFIVKEGCKGWTATRKWGVSYLEEIMSDTPVKVAITPDGSV